MASAVAPTDEPIVPDLDFATRLLIARRKRGLTQKQAAEACGLGAKAWDRWEHGTKPQDMEAVVKAVASGLRVDRDWLMWGLSDLRHYLTEMEMPPGPMTLPNMDSDGRPLPDPELAVAS